MAEDETKEAPKAKKPKAKYPAHYVVPGCAITSKKGVLASEKDADAKTVAEVKAEWLEGGEKSLKSLIESDHVKVGG